MSLHLDILKGKINGFYSETEELYRDLAYYSYRLRTPKRADVKMVFDKGPYTYMPVAYNEQELKDTILKINAQLGDDNIVLFGAFTDKGLYIEDSEGNTFLFDENLIKSVPPHIIRWHYV